MNKNQNMLEEGKSYKFLVKGVTEMPGAGSYFILEDPFGIKHLIRKEYYEVYNFKTSEYIICAVDKINCDGKIFLEPKHPHYEQGNIYEFEFNGWIDKLNREGDKTVFALMKDKFGNLAHIILGAEHTGSVNTSDIIQCKVNRLTKGKLYLSDPKIDIAGMGFEAGETYLFRIKNSFKSPNGKEYFVLHDQKGYKHILLKKYYRNYGFNIDDQIRCKVIKFSSKGYFLLEPEHPFYKEDTIYDFNILRLEKKNLIVKDIFGYECKIKIHASDKEKYSLKDCVLCEIIGFRKGKLVLQVNSEQYR
ncbi:MAG: hypothetical protein KAG99_06895 [Bacteroidales bacterium]|nr:hypothetical protein [Bacteroidales bacterium]